MKGDECQKSLSHKYNSCKLLCMFILVSLCIWFSPFTFATDKLPHTTYITEGLTKELEDSLIKAEKEGRLIDYYIEKESIFRDQGKYSEIINMSNYIEQRIRKKDIAHLFPIYECRPIAYYEIGDYQAMFDDLEKSLDMKKSSYFLFSDASAYLSILDFHLTFNRLDLAQQYLNKARTIALNHKNTTLDDNWNNLNFLIHLMQGQFYRLQKNWEEANIEYSKAEKYIVGPRHSVVLNIQKYFFHKDKEEYEIADSIYNKLLTSDMRVSLVDLSNIRLVHVQQLLSMEKLDSAKNELNNINPDSLPIIYKPDLYELLSDIYIAEHDYPRAYHYLKKSSLLKDSLDSEYQRAYSKNAIDKFEMKQMEKSLQQERQGKVRHIIIISLLGLSLAAGSIWAFLVIRRNKKRKRDQAIAETSLGNRNAALSAAVMRADNYKSIYENIKTILTSNESDSQKINEISKQLNESNYAIEPLHHVSNSNDDAMQEFLDKLRYVHPDLTNAELRMAQLILMNIPNKGIAELQNRSLGTIKNQKYSLRKKLGTEVPMEQYLKQISAASNSELEELANAAQNK